ncbi:ABC1 family-domain-containing protein [Dichotomocladium elegans]|nr:ABC1 family-domain-containing protein [Dichotomocladium elegans]
MATAAGVTGLYYVNEDARHVAVALQRCGTAGLVGAQVAADYKMTLSKSYASNEEYKEAKRQCDLRCANRVLDALQRLGGIYIKLGQHVSAMVYILPPEWTDTMAVLQDRCDPTPREEIERLFLTDYGEPLEAIFEEFDWKPLGVASLAQVHRARLRPGPDGTRAGNDGWVAVKLQHPALDEFCKIDMETVSLIFDVITKAFPDFGFRWLVDEMRESLPRELDFVHEARNSRLVAQNFADDMKYRRTALMVPEVIWAKRRIMCMEFIEGARVDNIEYLKQHKIDPAQVSAELTSVFSKMIFLHGFVHCDPHPGNIIVRPCKRPHSKYNFDLVLLDHGLYRDLTEQMRVDYAHLWTSLIRGDEEGIRTYAKRVGGTDTYQLFACILTGRAWETVHSADLSSVRSKAELAQMSVGAMEFIVDIADILSRLPRVVLLLLKTSDLLRHMDEVLRTTTTDDHLTYVIMGQYCTKAVWLDAVKHIRERVAQVGFNFTLFKALARVWWNYFSLVGKLWIYEHGMTWIAPLIALVNKRSIDQK